MTHIPGLPPLLRPAAGAIGWTPDRFTITICYPNGSYHDDTVRTWEQAVEHARRLIGGAGDPVFWVRIRTVEPIRELSEPTRIGPPDTPPRHP